MTQDAMRVAESYLKLISAANNPQNTPQEMRRLLHAAEVELIGYLPEIVKAALAHQSREAEVQRLRELAENAAKAWERYRYAYVSERGPDVRHAMTPWTDCNKATNAIRQALTPAKDSE